MSTPPKLIHEHQLLEDSQHSNQTPSASKPKLSDTRKYFGLDMHRHAFAINSLWAITSSLLLYISHVHAQNSFSGTWSRSNDITDIYFSSNWTNFTAKWAEAENYGFRMHDYEVYFNGTNPVYLGVFRTGEGASASWFTPNWEELLSKVSEFEKDGLLMHDYESYEIDGQRWHAGIFRAAEGKQSIYNSSDWDNFMENWNTRVYDGYRMYDFETYVTGDVREYVGIFRTGTGLEMAAFATSFDDMNKAWTEAAALNLTAWDFEFFEDGNSTTYGFIFTERSSPGLRYGWFGIDWEAFRALNNDRVNEGFALDDIETSPSDCKAACTDQVLASPEDSYYYEITRTETHCEGLPHTCTLPGDPVVYRSPVLPQGGSQFVKMTTTLGIKQLFTLPFSNPRDMMHNGWLYAPGLWHWAIDYLRYTGDPNQVFVPDAIEPFNVSAAAPGTVIYVGWDWFGGGTVVISHDDGTDVDRYRTIYMHLRNGAAQDCKDSWEKSSSQPILDTTPEGRAIVGNFTNFLEATGCTRNGTGTPGSDYWGGMADRIAVAPGDIVTRGQFIATSGSTGPGGCNCLTGAAQSVTPPLVNTHLHIFFTRRDETDNRWYFFDPYGIYGPPVCYPTSSNATGPSDTPCARYPIGWVDGVPQLPTQ